MKEAAEEVAQTFEALEDEYFRARAVDIRDIGNRLINFLESGHERTEEIPKGSVIIAKELTPSETASFSAEIIRGILTEKGGPLAMRLL